MKRVLSLILTAALLLVTIGALPVLADDAQLADMALIKSRFAEYFLHNSSVGNYGDLSKAEEYLATIREDGSWEDIDYYNDTNTANGLIWQPKKALARMLAMAIFYADPQGGHYHDAAMLAGVQKGMEYWRSIRGANPENANFEGPWCSNWWENGFGIGQYVYKIGILLEKELTAENLAFICRKLDTFGSTNTGQNALWQTQNALHRALLENNADQFRKIVDQCLAVNLDVSGDMGAEALMVDNSFHAHGNLMYSNGYGKSLIQDLSLWIYYLRDTSFALPKKTLDLMADYILDGNRWMIRGDMLELGTVYQNHNQNWAYNNYAVPLRRMIESDPARAAEYQIMLDNLSGLRADNGLSGNKDMWTSAYMSHMREGYGVNVRTDTAGMKSTEWRSNWPDGGRLCLVFWTTAAMTTVMVDGHEYSDVLPTYDWRHLPGTTAPHYYSDRENDFDNGNDDSIGVSNGVTGAMSYVYEKTDIRPQSGNPYSGATTGGSVGVFFFDDEYVMLGADIHSNHKAPIHTTINQTLAGDVSVNGVPVASGTADADYQADYVYNNRIGYIFPETTAVKVSNQDQTGLNVTQWDQNAVDTPDTFTLYVDHGVAPKEASYACIVLPNATAEQVADYSQNNRDVVIVANSKEVQAVRHDGLKQTQVLFYKAGQLAYAPGKTVQADGPCSLIIDESGDAPLITEAVSNRDPGTVRTVYLTVDGQTSRTVYESGATPYAGQSVTQTAGDSVFITAGQSLTGTVGAAFDGDNDTAWVAASAEDSWIRYDMRDALDLDGITIRFGDSYPSKYDLLASNDGEKWDTVYSEENGNGGEDMIPLDTTARYWKLECREIVASDVEKGDVDGKDGVTAADALMALQAATGKIALTAAQEQSADVDGQPGVSAADALMILQIATGKIAPVSAPSNGGVAIKEIVFTDKDFALATPEYPAMTALEQAIARTVRPELYSEETLAVYRAALRKAQKLLVLPYATAAMVNAMTDELSAAIAGLQYGDLGSVMATLTYDNPTFTGHKVTMGTPWASFDNMVDLSDRDLSKIYLFFTVNFALSGGERAGMFSSGRILLRSPNTDGKENNAYVTIGNYGWHEGENVVYLPLSAMTGQTNQMDWGAVNTFRLYVDSLNQYDMDVTLTISPVQILDSEHRKPDSEAKIQLRALIKEQRTDLELYTLESIAAYNDLYEEAAALYKNAEADDDAVNAMIARLQASDDLLVLDEDAKDLLGIICAEEKTSSVAHRMDLTINADEPIDLSGYTADELYLQFDLRVDTSHVDPAPKDDYWLTNVKNGKVELGAVAKGDRVVAIPQLHSTQYLSRSGSFVTIRKPLPADLVAQGQVQTFFMFLYNDTGNLGVGEDGVEWNSGSGVTFTVRNVKILADKKE